MVLVKTCTSNFAVFKNNIAHSSKLNSPVGSNLISGYSTLLQRKQEIYISQIQEHFLVFIFSLKKFDAKFIRDLNF